MNLFPQYIAFKNILNLSNICLLRKGQKKNASENRESDYTDLYCYCFASFGNRFLPNNHGAPSRPIIAL